MTFAVGIRSATVAEIAGASQAALDRPLTHDGELTASTATDGGVLLGAFQRRGDAEALAPTLPRYRRISGGTHVVVAPGSVHLLLTLARANAIDPTCRPDAIVNRHVRPLLRVLGAAYFGRDWISKAKTPVGYVGFAHDATTGRAVFEAFLPSEAAWSEPSRASYRGAAPGVARVNVDAIREAYVAACANGASEGVALGDAAAHEEADQPAWSAHLDEAIGPLTAGADAGGRMTLGGELMASRDAVAALNDAVAGLARPLDVVALGAAVDAAFASSRGAVVFGVRSLTSIRDVLLAADLASAAAT